MINLSNEPIPIIHAGRKAIHPYLTSSQIKQEAYRLLRSGLSEHAWRVIQHLAVGGIMNAGQLRRVGVKLRTLQKYDQLQLLDRHPLPAPALAGEFERWGLPFDQKNPEETKLYLLGPIGLEIARMQGLSPEEGFLAYPVERFMRQVVINEIIMRLSTFGLENGWKVSWVHRMEATHTTEEGQVILEPAAMLVFQKAENIRPFFIEYYDQLSPFQVNQTIQRYEKAYRSESWREQFVGETFPQPLMVFTDLKIGKAYRYALAEHGSTRCTYYGKLLQGVFSAEANLGNWTNIQTGNRETILP